MIWFKVSSSGVSSKCFGLRGGSVICVVALNTAKQTASGKPGLVTFVLRPQYRFKVQQVQGLGRIGL